MNLIAKLIFLIGLAPGAFLPSAITDQLLAPPMKAATDGDQTETPGGERENPSEQPGSLHAASAYTAIRPASFPFTKGDLRAIQVLHERLLSNPFVRESRILVDRVHGHQALMQPDHCLAHRARVTSPAIAAQAPPSLQ